MLGAFLRLGVGLTWGIRQSHRIVNTLLALFLAKMMFTKCYRYSYNRTEVYNSYMVSLNC